MTFGETLRYLLDCEELSQKEFASALHLAASTVSSYVQCAREPDFATLIRIADYFGVTTDYLLGHQPTSRAVEEEWELLALYHRFTPAQKSLLLQQACLLEQYTVGRGKN